MITTAKEVKLPKTWLTLRKPIVKFQTSNFNPTPSMKYLGANGKPTGESKHFPANKSIRAIDRVFDPETKVQRILAYRKSEVSVWQDEQSDEIQRDPNKYPAETIAFNERGQIVISTDDRQLLTWLLLSDFCGNKPNRNTDKPIIYNYIKEGEVHEIMIERETAADEVKGWCIGKSNGQFITPFEEIKQIAYAAGLNVEKEESSIRWELKLRAEADPIRFRAFIDSPDTKKKYYMRLAIERNIIMLTPAGTIKWTNGTTICDCPKGRDPIDYFVNLKTSDAVTVYNAIKEFTNASEVPTFNDVIAEEKVEEAKINTVIPTKDEALEYAPKTEGLKLNVVYPESLQELVKTAIEKDIIKANQNRKYAIYKSAVSGRKEFFSTDKKSIYNDVYAWLTANPNELTELTNRTNNQ